MKNTFNEIVKSIFERALKLDQLSRKEFFDNLNEEEKEYTEEVKSLLDSYGENSDFLEIDAGRDIFSEDNVGPHPLIGKHIGAYLIEEEIGVGGMGIVFSGKRDDKEFEQRVAIKILKQGLTSEYLVKRFENERQTLANLQHPNIAKLFDGGKTNEGLPYLVMEYIDGVSITKYCETGNLSVDQKLELFISVCNAVEYAHQNLIIHRDIKPENILVNSEGRVKLLDFGVSKLLDEDLISANAGLTKTGTWHLTPEYASPEQINGETINTSSDIYSLGVLLYRIISQQNPYKIYNSSPLAISKILSEGKIIKPSDVIQNTTRATGIKKEFSQKGTEFQKDSYKKIKGDLDNIILKAMHKDTSQRYASVKDFAIDISKYLNGHPVSAHEDTLIYRFNKFVKRHKAGVAIFILFNIVVLAGIAAIIYQGRIAAEERDNAKVEVRKFEEINNFLLDMFTSADPEAEGRNIKVYDLLEKAAEDVEVKLKNYPKTKSAIKQTLGSTFIGLGEYAKAQELLLAAHESNILLFGTESKETAKSSHQLGLCYDWIGNIQLADSFYKEGISIYEKISEDPPKALADNLNDFGTLLSNVGEYDSSNAILNRALDIYGLYNKEKGQKEAITVNNIAVNYHHLLNVELAEKFYLQAKDILVKLYGTNRPEIASIYNNLAFIYLDNKDYKASEETFKKSYEIKLEVLGGDHPYVGLALINMGMLKFVEKDYQRAEELLLKAIDLYIRTKATKDPFLSLAYYWLGRSYLESNKLNKSENVLRKSIRLREELYSKNHSKTWSAKGELGVCLFKLKNYSEAEKLIVGSLEFYKNAKYPDMKKITRYTEYSASLFKEIGNIAKSKIYQSELRELQDSEK